MQNLYETVKKAQMVVQVEAVRVQKELAEYVLLLKSLITNLYLFIYFCRNTIDYFGCPLVLQSRV